MALGRKPIEIVNEGRHQLLVKADSWDRIFLKEVAKVQNGFAFSSKNFVKKGGLPLIRIRDIDQETTVDRYDGEYSEEFIIKKGDILIGMDGDFNAAIWKGEEALLNQRVCRIIPTSNLFDRKFLFLCLQPYLNAINEETSSVTVKHLSSKTIEEIPLPYPDLEEQRDIVSKIEELFSELDKGVEQLKIAQQQLKIYRQAVLKWAFEGRFTNENVKEGELPEGWAWCKLGDNAFVTKLAGFEYTKLVKYKEVGEIPVIKAQNVSKDGFVERNFMYVERELMEKLPRSRLYGGEVLMVFVGAGLGQVGIVPYGKEYFLGPNVAKIALNEKYDNKYVFYFLSSVLGFGNINSLSKATAQGSISMGNIRNVSVPIIPLNDQLKIVSEIENRFSLADKLDDLLTISLKKSEILKQSVLKMAFEGKLLAD